MTKPKKAVKTKKKSKKMLNPFFTDKDFKLYQANSLDMIERGVLNQLLTMRQ